MSKDEIRTFQPAQAELIDILIDRFPVLVVVGGVREFGRVTGLAAENWVH
jgi:hypothetical protein